MAKFENLSKDISPRVMGPWPPFCHYTFLDLETKCDISVIEVGSQTLKLLSRTCLNFLKTYYMTVRDITQGLMDPWPLFLYSLYSLSFSMFIQIFSSLAFIVPEKSVTKFLRMAKFENLSKDISPRVMGLWPPFCHYTFFTLETKCEISFIEVGPQT